MRYPMRADGVATVDGIGSVFPALFDSITSSGRKYRKRLGRGSLDPAGKLDKHRLLFLHDLIHFAGPLKYRSLVDLVSLLFGAQDYGNLREAIALLVATRFVTYQDKGGLINSNRSSTFLVYQNADYFKVNFQMIRLRGSLRGQQGVGT